MQTHLLLSAAALSAIAATDLRATQLPVPRPCEPFENTLRTDPNNLDAAVNLGRCTLRDEELSAPGAGSTPLAFRTSWTPALRALRRVVAADPSYTRAYGPLFRMLFAETRDACSRVTGNCLHVAPVLRSGDSLLTPPRLVERRPPPDTVDTYDEVIAESRATERPSLVEARSLAERWLSVAPNDRRPHEHLGRALLRLGDSVAASNSFQRAAELGTPESRRAIFWDRFTALVKANRGVEARRVLEEAASDPGGDTSQLAARRISGMHALLGQYRPMPIDPTKQRADSIRFAEIRRRMRPDTTWKPVRPLPSFDSLLAVGDTAEARRVAARIDSMHAPPPGARRIPSIGQEVLHSARMHLTLRDTARAEERLESITNLVDHRRLEYSSPLIFGDPRPWMGHAWALAGDIAAARGRTDDAARMYRRVIGLWEGGDPDTKPVVEHARTRLAALPRR